MVTGCAHGPYRRLFLYDASEFEFARVKLVNENCRVMYLTSIDASFSQLLRRELVDGLFSHASTTAATPSRARRVRGRRAAFAVWVDDLQRRDDPTGRMRRMKRDRATTFCRGGDMGDHRVSARTHASHGHDAVVAAKRFLSSGWFGKDCPHTNNTR